MHFVQLFLGEQDSLGKACLLLLAWYGHGVRFRKEKVRFDGIAVRSFL